MERVLTIDFTTDGMVLYYKTFEDDKNVTEYQEIFNEDNLQKLPFDQVYMSGNIFSIKKFIVEHINIFEDKIINIDNNFSLNKIHLQFLKKVFGEFDNILYIINGNVKGVTLDEYEKTIDKVNEFTENIKSLNLSPFETIMYVYDYVRDRKYCKESDGEESFISRDLTQVLFGDKIVCAGFVNMFNVLLSELGFKVAKIVLKKRFGTSRHVRTIVYIDDPKYDVDGLYFFDPTFDCKKKDDAFLKKYKHFARTFSELEGFDEGKYVIESYSAFEPGSLYYYRNKINRFNFNDFEQFNRILELIEEEKLDDTLEYDNNFILGKMKKVVEKAETAISAETFLTLFYNVRKVQYYQNPSKYVLDMAYITEVLCDSNVKNTFLKKGINIAASMFNITIPVDSIEEAQVIVDNYEKEHNLEQDIARIKLTKTLSEVLKVKKDD